MKRLILMRHAKSDWNHPGLADHDRPLNKRGRKAAPAMGAWLTADRALVEKAVKKRLFSRAFRQDTDVPPSAWRAAAIS